MGSNPTGGLVCCKCCVLSGRGLCDELITRPEESYRMWCVVVCDLETSRKRRPWPALGRSDTGGEIYSLQNCNYTPNSKTSRPDLGPSQTPIKWVPWPFPPGVGGGGGLSGDDVQLTTHLQWRTQEFCSDGFNKFSWRQRERGSGGGSPLFRGSGDSCNLVKEIYFHIVKFS